MHEQLFMHIFLPFRLHVWRRLKSVWPFMSSIIFHCNSVCLTVCVSILAHSHLIARCWFSCLIVFFCAGFATQWSRNFRWAGRRVLHESTWCWSFYIAACWLHNARCLPLGAIVGQLHVVYCVAFTCLKIWHFISDQHSCVTSFYSKATHGHLKQSLYFNGAECYRGPSVPAADKEAAACLVVKH